MGQSPLKIESYYLRKLEYQLKEEFETGIPDGTLEKIDPKIQVNVQSGKSEEDENDWRVEIEVTGGKEAKFPYTFKISFVGYFRVADEFPQDKRELLVTVNGPSILFSAAREFISIVTARSPYPPILLPSISFVPDKAGQVQPKGKVTRTAKPLKGKADKAKPQPKKSTK